MWDLLEPGIKPVSQGEFLTTVPPGKPVVLVSAIQQRGTVLYIYIPICIIFIFFFIFFSIIGYFKILNRVPCARLYVIYIITSRTLLFIYFMYVAFICREGNGSPLQYSCLGTPMDGGAWWATVYSPWCLKELDTTSLSLFSFMHWKGNGNTL